MKPPTCGLRRAPVGLFGGGGYRDRQGIKTRPGAPGGLSARCWAAVGGRRPNGPGLDRRRCQDPGKRRHPRPTPCGRQDRDRRYRSRKDAIETPPKMIDAGGARCRVISVASMLRLLTRTNREPLKTKENKSQHDATWKGPGFSARPLVCLEI